MTAGRVALALLFALAAGCARRPWSATPAAAVADPAADVTWGDDLAAHGRPLAARDVYQRVLQAHPKEPVGGDALWGLALLLVDVDGPLRDYRAALAAFDRLLADYPSNRHAVEARAWRAVLLQTQRLEAESARLRADLERLKQLDMEMERR
ncbi:MAG TPA: tetratricopeptide repeat protein [Candidatus Binatia bacterium]|jgi:tetratricopeptide (TPR) repeat protein|nr:tetratricopeptide repeat protein [Candidatus Binatia bacterium]